MAAAAAAPAASRPPASFLLLPVLLLAALIVLLGVQTDGQPRREGGGPPSRRRRLVGMAVKKVSKEQIRSGRGLFPSCSDVLSCCKGAVIDAVDTAAGEPVLKEFLSDPVKSSVSRIKAYVSDHPDLRLAAANVFNEAVEDVKKRKGGEQNKLSYRDAANVARTSWDKLSMKFGISDEEGHTRLLPKPSRAMAMRLAKKFMSEDGTLSYHNFQKYRQELMDTLVKKTVDKRVKPRLVQYLVGMTATTALLAFGRSKLNMTGEAADVVNFLLPTIIVGPALGAALTFKIKGGSFSQLGSDLNTASDALVETRKTIRWTHNTMNEAARFRNTVNRTALSSLIGTVWSLMSPGKSEVQNLPANAI